MHIPGETAEQRNTRYGVRDDERLDDYYKRLAAYASFAAATYYDAQVEYAERVAVPEGSAETLATLWTRYNFTTGRLKGLWLGAGFVQQHQLGSGGEKFPQPFRFPLPGLLRLGPLLLLRLNDLQGEVAADPAGILVDAAPDPFLLGLPHPEKP